MEKQSEEYRGCALSSVSPRNTSAKFSVMVSADTSEMLARLGGIVRTFDAETHEAAMARARQFVDKQLDWWSR
jgi:hypothetical protein